MWVIKISANFFERIELFFFHNFRRLEPARIVFIWQHPYYRCAKPGNGFTVGYQNECFVLDLPGKSLQELPLCFRIQRGGRLVQ